MFFVASSGSTQHVSESGRHTPAAAYLNRVAATVTRIGESLPRITAVAEAAAENIVGGGELWLAGNEGFILEACGRAGGMMAARRWQRSDDLSEGDVVLLGSTNGEGSEDMIGGEAGREGGALVILFGPKRLPGTDLFVDAFAPPANDPTTLPTISPALAASLWVFTGELVAALIRRGKMPPMYQSGLVPGGAERNEQHLRLRWEPVEVASIGPGVLGREYLECLTQIVQRLQATQMDKFAEAGRMAAAALRAGHTVWYDSLGHLSPKQLGQVGDPGFVKLLPPGPTPEKLEGVLERGDLVLYVGMYEPYGPWVETAHACGAKIVTVVSGTPQRQAGEMGADINISGCWPFGESVVEVPGYDVKILPPTGVVQSSAYWMFVAEAAAYMR